MNATLAASPLEGLPVAAIALNPDGRIVYANHAAVDLFGHTAEALATRSLLDLIAGAPPTDFKPGEARLTRFKRQDGSAFEALLSFGDQDARSVAVIVDVSAQQNRERALNESEARYRFVVERQTEMVSLARFDGELIFVNDAYLTFYGATPDDMDGRNLFDFVPVAAREDVKRHLQRVLWAESGLEDRNEVTLPDGHRRWIAWTNRLVFAPWSGEPMIHSVGRDITAQVNAERRLEESEARYRLIAENTADMVFQLDDELKIVYASPACRNLLALQPDELQSQNFVALVHEDDRGRIRLALESLVGGRPSPQAATCRLMRPEARFVWAEVSLSATSNAEGRPNGVVGVARDISARKAAEDELARANTRLRALADLDGLTGLYNRRALDEAMSPDVAGPARYTACLLIDVDHFKAFNDLYGHLAGDDALRRIARALSKGLRSSDFAARYGGEEFVALLATADEKVALMVAERLRAAVARLGLPHQGAGEGRVTISIGVCADPETASVADLLAGADRGLYDAKRAGRNRVSATTLALGDHRAQASR